MGLAHFWGAAAVDLADKVLNRPDDGNALIGLSERIAQILSHHGWV